MTIRSSILLGILIGVTTILGTYFVPFAWLVFLLFLVGSLTDMKHWKVFLIGLLVPGLVWICITLIREANFERSVSDLVGNILTGIPSWLVFVVVGLTIGIVSGFSVLSGNLLRSILVKNSKHNNQNG